MESKKEERGTLDIKTNPIYRYQLDSLKKPLEDIVKPLKDIVKELHQLNETLTYIEERF